MSFNLFNFDYILNYNVVQNKKKGAKSVIFTKQHVKSTRRPADPNAGSFDNFILVKFNFKFLFAFFAVYLDSLNVHIS